MSRTQPVKSLDGQGGDADIEAGLALVRVAHMATIDSGFIDNDMIRAVHLTLDLAERYLAAGHAWAQEMKAAAAASPRQVARARKVEAAE